MRVVTWNLRKLRDLGAARAVLAELEPDVALLQEAGDPSDTRDLARSLGMEAVTTPRPVLRRAIANAVLLRPSLEVRAARLARFGGTGLREPRGALVVDAIHGGVDVRLVSAHLGLDARERVRHARILGGLLDTRSILGADLNAAPDSVAARAIAGAGLDALALAARDADEGRTDDRTYPADAPDAAIDRIVVGRAWSVTRAWVVGGDRADLLAAVLRASDHRPVAADLSLHSTA